MFGKRNKKFQHRCLTTSTSSLCVCPQCQYSISHNRGVPCFTLICPICKIPLTKQDKLGNSREKSDTIYSKKSEKKPVVDTTLCSGCGACVNECLFGAISLMSGKALISNDNCNNCRACIDACPQEAIM